MAQGQAFRPRAQEAAQGPRAGEGLLGPQEHRLHVRQGAGRALAHLRLPRPQEPQAQLPPALDHAHQRGCAGERALVQPVHRRPQGGRRRARPEGARRPGGARSGAVREARRAGQGRCTSRQLIASRDNEKLKLVRKLHERRWRDKLGLFVCEGEDLVEAATAEPVELLVAGENVEPALLARGLDRGAPAAGDRRLPAGGPPGGRRRGRRCWRCGGSPTRETWGR